MNEVGNDPSCDNCLVGVIIEMLNERCEESAAEMLLCFYCLSCADCTVPSLSHNWIPFQKNMVEDKE